MQYFARITDIEGLLLAPLQAVLRDAQKLMDMEIDAARLEGADGEAPYDLLPQQSVRAESAAGQAGDEPNPAVSAIPLSMKYPEPFRIAPTAPIEPAFLSAFADASAASIRTENPSGSPPYSAVSVPTDSETADFGGGPISARAEVPLTGNPPESLRIAPTAPIKPAFSSASAGASAPASIRSENRSGPPPYSAISVPAESTTVDSGGGAPIPAASAIPIAGKPPNAPLPVRSETASFRSAPPVSSDSRLTSPSLSLAVRAGDSQGMPVAQIGLSPARLAVVPPVVGMEPDSTRRVGIPLRPRYDNNVTLSFTMPDQASVLLSPRELQAAARLAPALEPSFEQAYRLTQAKLDEPAATAPEPESPGLVRNTFNVTVALGGNGGSEGLDRTALEQALTDILRTAARRHGLEI